MTLGELQRAFTNRVGHLIRYAYDQLHVELTFGEAYRTPEQAAWDASHGTGIAHSEHCLRLAVDLNLFVDGVWQTAITSTYADLGTFWKNLSDPAQQIDCAWGGDFHRKDANHFSVRWQGVA